MKFNNRSALQKLGRASQRLTVQMLLTQHYDGMLVSIQHRASQRINLNGNYTWSHCIGDYGARNSSANGTNVDNTYQDPNNRRRDRGNCESDQRHAFNLTAVAETPQLANRILSIVGAGWR